MSQSKVDNLFEKLTQALLNSKHTYSNYQYMLVINQVQQDLLDARLRNDLSDAELENILPIFISAISCSPKEYSNHLVKLNELQQEIERKEIPNSRLNDCLNALTMVLLALTIISTMTLAIMVFPPAFLVPLTIAFFSASSFSLLATIITSLPNFNNNKPVELIEHFGLFKTSFEKMKIAADATAQIFDDSSVNTSLEPT